MKSKKLYLVEFTLLYFHFLFDCLKTLSYYLQSKHYYKPNSDLNILLISTISILPKNGFIDLIDKQYSKSLPH